MKPMERPRAPGTGNWRDAIKGPFAICAATLLLNGYSPVPILPKTKRPPDEGWNALRVTPLTEEQVRIQAAERPAYGLGVAGGYGGLVPIDIDTDDPDIIAAICSVLPAPLVAKKGRTGYTVFYRAPEGWTASGRKFKPTPTSKPLVEILATGQTVIPPTLHPDTGTPYQWLTPATLLNTQLAMLPRLDVDFVERLAEALRPWCSGPVKQASPSANSLTGNGSGEKTVIIRPGSGPSADRLRIYALDVLHKRADELAGMPDESGRNNALLASVSRVGSWVHHGIISESEMRAAFHGAYDRCGAMTAHGLRQFEATTRNGLKLSSGDELRTPESDNIQPLASVDVTSLRAEVHAASNVIELLQAQAPVTADDFIFDDEFTAIMPPALIRGLLPRNGLVIDGGQSGAGKTFAEVDMAVALASGGDWFGQPCRERVGVVYIAAEGQSSIQRRFIAAKRHRNLEGESLPVAVPKWNSVNLRNPKARALIIKKLLALKEKIQERYGVRLGAIVLDTVSSTCPMKDENSNAEVAIVCVELREIADALDAVLIAVHHFGKAEDSGLRGGSAWRANCDHSRIFLATRESVGTPASDRRMALEKNRLGPEGEIIGFDLAIVPFGADEYGDAVTECAIVTKGRVVKKQKLTQLEKDFTGFYYAAFAEYRHHEGMGLRPNEGAVPIDLVREKFYLATASGQERRTRQQQDALRNAWKRAFKSAQGHLYRAETIANIEWIWPTQREV